MLYNFYFDIAAVMLNLMLLLIIYMRRTYPTVTCMLYKQLLWLNLISSSADLVSAVTISFPERVPLLLNKLISFVYLLSHNLTAVVFLIYVIYLIRGNFGKKAERITWMGLTIFEFIILFISIFNGCVFGFDEELHYVNGPMIYALYAAALSMMLYALVLFIRHRKRLNVFQMTTNVTFLSMMIGAVIFQFFFPQVLIESFCAAIAFLMMNFALDNPALYFYGNTFCFNQTAFDNKMAARLAQNRNFYVLAFTFDDQRLFKSKFGDQVFDSVISQTITVCHKHFGQKNVYLLNDDCFAITNLEPAKLDSAIETLTKYAGRNIDIGHGYADLIPHFCVFSHPGYAESVGDVNNVLHLMLFDLFMSTGNRVTYVDRTLLDNLHRENDIIHLIRDAITYDRFEVNYQPLYERETGKYRSAEALVRLTRQIDPYVSPAEFIPIAEKNGLILDVGEIVFEKVCKFWHENDLASLGLEYVEINLSMLQLMQRSCLDRLIAICKKHDVPPSCINLEITETAECSEAEKVTIQENLNYMLDCGFTFSLDDFGSGYATATYIAEMPFSMVKIDKNILWKGMKEPGFRIVLENSLYLIQAFKLKSVVEGVETQKMADTLAQLGCDYFQGYLYSKPIGEDAFVKFLQEHQ